MQLQDGWEDAGNRLVPGKRRRCPRGRGHEATRPLCSCTTEGQGWMAERKADGALADGNIDSVEQAGRLAFEKLRGGEVGEI